MTSSWEWEQRADTTHILNVLASWGGLRYCKIQNVLLLSEDFIQTMSEAGENIWKITAYLLNANQGQISLSDKSKNFEIFIFIMIKMFFKL